MEIQLKAKINAAQRVIDQHGEWWRVLSQTETLLEIESLDFTMHYRQMYCCRAKRTISKDCDELFSIVGERENSVREEIKGKSNYQLLESLLCL